jgi:hypothetical protein
LREEKAANQAAEIAELKQALEARHHDDGLKQQAFEFVQQEIDRGNIELDGSGNVLPLQSKMKE